MLHHGPAHLARWPSMSWWDCSWALSRIFVLLQVLWDTMTEVNVGERILHVHHITAARNCAGIVSRLESCSPKHISYMFISDNHFILLGSSWMRSGKCFRNDWRNYSCLYWLLFFITWHPSSKTAVGLVGYVVSMMLINSQDECSLTTFVHWHLVAVVVVTAVVVMWYLWMFKLDLDTENHVRLSGNSICWLFCYPVCINKFSEFKVLCYLVKYVNFLEQSTPLMIQFANILFAQ